MREATISLPRLAAIAATRGMLGIGIGLLLSERLGSKARCYAGYALAAVGALSTIPLAIGVVKRVKKTKLNGHPVRYPEVVETEVAGEGLAAD
jgi:hypothetical protein